MSNKYQELLAERTQNFSTVTAEIKNNKIASMLKALSSGKDGEMTAGSQYMYQHVITKNSYPEISEALEQIAINEMEHQDALMSAVVAFGGNPTYTNGQGSFWNGRFVNYDNNVKKFLKENITGEEMAIQDYEKAKLKTNNDSLKALFDEIIHDEKIHIKIFNEMLADLS